LKYARRPGKGRHGIGNRFDHVIRRDEATEISTEEAVALSAPLTFG